MARWQMSKLIEAAGSRRDSTPTHLDDRITAAFADGAKSDDVASLIREAEAAAIAAGDTAELARSRALDPALSAANVAAARREMDDAAFRRDRLQVAAKRLGERLREVRADEEDQRRRIAYMKAKAERDKLAAELKAIYPPIEAQFRDLMTRIDTNDKQIKYINAPRAAEGCGASSRRRAGRARPQGIRGELSTGYKNHSGTAPACFSI
jgi:hypothetical protein